MRQLIASRRRRWNRHEELRLRDLLRQGLSYREAGAALGRTVRAVEVHMQRRREFILGWLST